VPFYVLLDSNGRITEHTNKIDYDAIPGMIKPARALVFDEFDNESDSAGEEKKEEVRELVFEDDF
jgi:hypothetical protein